MRAKFNYVRSKAILEACRGIPCQQCGIEDGTVVAAHSNQARHGKGRGIKASDIYVAALCRGCHHEIDQGWLFTRSERELLWDDAHVKTVQLLHDSLEWPVGVEYPV